MKISRGVSIFLLCLSAFMVFEWIMLATNLGSGPRRSTAFYVVHGVLVGVNVILALALAAIGWRGWRGSRR
ncbi:hypothetical protein DPM19_09995 [Actinomadura craniellae]|uniref:Uncharacterized protein n=1 Tax=Actinomadura craniellae TaxID=2231787 RepID=A0A365H7S3_9ACTN|nr:hypothetical protein [Actinomadura craniellae]RAY15062.1 hypothetical protein DPM19_09995 [Actinomadura craniellae]